MSDFVVVEDQGHARVIRMNRPEKKNAASLELAWGVIEAIRATVLEDDVWVIGLTGTGDAFCAGLDFSPGEGQEQFIPLSEQNSYLDELGWVSRFFYTLRQECDKPIVGGINGVAVGAGLSLAMATDIRIMSEDARLLAGYSRIGASPDGGLSITLSQAMDYEPAMRFLLENRTVPVDEALRIGMVAADQFEARFHEYLQSLTKLSPLTGRATKRVVREATEIDLDKQLRWEIFNIRRTMGSADGQGRDRRSSKSATRSSPARASNTEEARHGGRNGSMRIEGDRTALMAEGDATWAERCVILDVAEPGVPVHDPDSPEWTSRDVYTRFIRMHAVSARAIRFELETGEHYQWSGLDENELNERNVAEDRAIDVDEARRQAIEVRANYRALVASLTE
jgi:2-(1,2-epoxy-1,2-dihydrophenyl)acetyl-CoA isomerase